MKIFGIFLSSLLFKLVASDSSMISTCVSNYTETINNRTGQVADKYHVNRQTVLDNLISTSTTTSLRFHNTTAGEPPYKSFAIYLCRGDTDPRLCGSCVTNLTEFVVTNSDNCTESVGYSDHCMIHYANYSFLGTASNTALEYSYDKFEDKISDAYNKTLKSAIGQVVMDAAWNSSNLFATFEAAVEGEDEKVYALAECTPDISRYGCSGCLKAAQTYSPRLGSAKFVWSTLTSCQLRYDNVSFFEVKSAATNSASPPVFIVAAFSLFLLDWLL